MFLETAATQGLELDFPVFLTLSFSGMRVGELVALQWDDIDFDRHTIRIIKTYYNPNNNTVQYSLGTPKMEGSARTIVVEEDIIDVLKGLKDNQERAKKRLNAADADKNFVFAKTERHSGYPILMERIGHTEDDTTRIINRHVTKEIKRLLTSLLNL